MKLTNSNANKFWVKNFGNVEIVTNDNFALAIRKLLNEEKDQENVPHRGYNKDKDTRKIFSEMITQLIFWPKVELKENEDYPPFVDKASIQFAINAFGPWSQIFHTIYHELDAIDNELNNKTQPIRFFHGRLSKENIRPKIEKVGDFVLRYNEKGEKEKEWGLILLWAKYGNGKLVIREENLRRRKLKAKNGKPSRVVWTWKKKTPIIGGIEIEFKNFPSIEEFLWSNRGMGKNLKRPILLINPNQSMFQ